MEFSGAQTLQKGDAASILILSVFGGELELGPFSYIRWKKLVVGTLIGSSHWLLSRGASS